MSNFQLPEILVDLNKNEISMFADGRTVAILDARYIADPPEVVFGGSNLTTLNIGIFASKVEIRGEWQNVNGRDRLIVKEDGDVEEVKKFNG